MLVPLPDPQEGTNVAWWLTPEGDFLLEDSGPFCQVSAQSNDM